MPKPHPRLAAATFAAALALVASGSTARAWIETGHKVVALVAWEDLTPATRAAVSDVLRHHARYDKDLLSGGNTDDPAPAAQMTADERDRRAFAASAVWPDLIKAQGHPMRVQYSHPNWHYIDLPYTPGPATQPATPAVKDDAKPGPHDVVEALTACVAELNDPATKPEQRAVDVCWITHLVGDIHQPLHCATEVDARFPTGDAGGNNQVVLRDGRYANTRANLHLVWDELPGEFASDDLDRYEALGLRADPRYARSAFASRLAEHDYMAWARDSHRMAIADAYLNGKLDTAAAIPGNHTGQTDRKPPGLPPGYLRRAEHDAMQQVALAGYRLADVLNGVFDPAAAADHH